MGLLKIVSSFKKKIRLNRMKKSIVNSHHDITGIDKTKVKDERKNGFSLSESAVYNLNKNNSKDYISTWESYQPRMKNSQYFTISDDKYLFFLAYSHFIKTPEVYALISNGNIVSVCDKTIDNETLFEFFIENNGGVIKDRGGCDGFEVYVFTTKEGKLIYKNKVIQKEELNNIVKKFENGIVQSRIIQGSFENGIFDKSINTIRIITVRKKDSDEHEIIGALQRIGNNRSMPVDNFSQGGGSAIINIQTGELGSMTFIDSFDENGERIFFDNHPDSGAKIKGTVIPRWNEIKKEIIDITRKVPFFDYIAWDIVLLDDGIAVIETNMKSALKSFQVHGGMRNEYLGQKYREKGYIE